MKKLVLLLAVVFSVSLFSCGGSNNATEAAADSAVVVEVVEAVEVAVPDSAVVADSAAAVVDSAAVAATPAE
ncbi:hypothetical protein [uncultured Muribaculum sp.]|uniref:hypothetical protein n=1 Tax=uncultured Muribaculum sp. TaxID=1918613 RepID=UPI0025B1D704|nr:hypothetical protein [uncultured Muribaculum sp.]